MKIANDTFLSGPNLWHPGSGLLLIVTTDEEDEGRLAWRPESSEVHTLFGQLRNTFRVVADSDELGRPDLVAASAHPLAELLAAVSACLVADFSIRPQAGRVLDVRDNHIRIFQPCDDRSVGVPAMRLALEVARRLLPAHQRAPGSLKALRERYWRFRRIARAQGLNQTTLGLARAAADRGIPAQRLVVPGQFVQLGQGCRRMRINETSTDRSSVLGRWLSKDKFDTASLLTASGVPTPQPVVVESADQAVQEWRRFAQPVVVKPRASGKGRGVTVGLTTEDEVRLAFETALAANGGGVIVERMVQGHDHRLLVVDGVLVAAAKRTPAHIVGDGNRTVQQLINALNRDPRRGMPFERLLEFVAIDDEAHAQLAAANLTLQSIPERGRTVRLRGAANISRGGTSQDVTDAIHPDNRELAERVARLVGVDVTGIDFLTPDIARSWRDVPSAILEVNGSPGLRPHQASNPARDVVGPIVDHLFHDRSDGRIPTAGITGSVGKTTTTRLVAAILARHGHTVGMCTTQGSFVGTSRVKASDSAGGRSAIQLLQDPRVEAGAFELARGGLVKFGMVLDAVDVGAVLNIHDNHLGLDGIEGREDLARLKRLVVENARKMAVLNADEPLCLAMREHARAPVCLMTEDAGNAEVARHLDSGGCAAVLDGQGAGAVIRLLEGTRVIGQIAAAELPAAWGGTYRPGLVTAMSAAAVANGMGVPFDTIRAALVEFQSTDLTNPGRMNFIDSMPFKLLVTWSDGAQSIRELSNYVDGLQVQGRKHLMFCAMGNRSDEFLMAMGGAAAGAYDRYVCSDWEDLRGREPGVVARMLARGLEAKGVDPDRISVAATHEEALRIAFAAAAPGDLLVVASFVSQQAREKIPALKNL